MSTLTMPRSPSAAASEKARIAASLYHFDNIARVVSAPSAVTEEDVAFFRANGYLAVADVLTTDEVEEAREALADVIHGRIPGVEAILHPEPDQKAAWPTLSPDERADLVRKVFRFNDYEPRLKKLGESHPALHSLLTRLMGGECREIQDMALLKPPFIGTEKPWHQDGAYFYWGPPERLVGVWIALDPATAENGCMHVLPGTHLEGTVPHYHLRDCQIPDNRVQVDRDVFVPLAPGGALFFSALLHHGTPPNSSPNRRWALQYHYADAARAHPIERRRHAELFFEDDHYAGCQGRLGAPLDEIDLVD